MRSQLGEKLMAKLTLNEARNLCRVFGEADPYRAVLLLLFMQTTSKWDLRRKMRMFPKNYRVPQATLYRRVNELSENFYLDMISTKRGRAGGPVNYYRLSLKGLLAAGIYGYALFLDSDIPISVREKAKVERWIRIFESSLGPAYDLYISFLRWHRERNVDLSKARVDMPYFSATMLLSMLDHPEIITEKQFRELAEPLIKLGIVPRDKIREVPVFVQNARNALQALGGSSLFTLLERTKRLDSRSATIKEA
jgi:hypothetical protein